MTTYDLQSEQLEERAILVGVEDRTRSASDAKDSLEELAQLADTAGAEVMERVLVKQLSIRAATFIGKGKCEMVAEKVRDHKATTVVFDDDLTPAQGRNLEKIMEVKVIDRTQMILDIFAQHARTKEGGLQIELAQLEYLLPRLRRMWTHLERQKGGIGLRGPGEKQLEMDRRRIQWRIAKVQGEIDHVRTRRAEQRRGRRRHGWALISLVGYTNAGKSTLFNAITGAGVLADDQLFATLDPTTRQVELPNNQQALVSDTVGFIRKLPHHLVESFKATLEEVVEADLLIHVMDASHPRSEQQMEAVNNVLRELGADGKPTILVVNKIDQEDARSASRRIASQFEEAVAVSARTGEGIEQLLEFVSDRLRNRNVTVDLRVPVANGKLISDVRRVGNVFEEIYEDGHAVIKVNLPLPIRGKWREYVQNADDTMFGEQ